MINHATSCTGTKIQHACIVLPVCTSSRGRSVGVALGHDVRGRKYSSPPQDALGVQSLYLCRLEGGSTSCSADTHSCRCPPWHTLRNTSTPPRPQTGRRPPAPPRWPRGEGGHRRPLCSVQPRRTAPPSVTDCTYTSSGTHFTVCSWHVPQWRFTV